MDAKVEINIGLELRGFMDWDADNRYPDIFERQHGESVIDIDYEEVKPLALNEHNG